MIRKYLRTLLLVLAISLLFAQPAQAAKSYYAEFFDVQIDLQQGGSAIVTETVKFHFEGDPFMFAFREVSARETDGLTFLEASLDGAPMLQGTEAGQLEVEPGDPLRVTWHFPPTSNASHVFVVRYRVDGVIRKDGESDTLAWRAVPEDHEYSIERSTVTLTYPAGAPTLGEPSLNRDYDVTLEENRVVLTMGALAEDQDLILTARFAPGSLTATAPQWQVRQERAAAARARAVPAGLIAGLATLLLGVLGLFTYIRLNRRELNLSPVMPIPNPPAEVSPAVVGKLTKQSHASMGAIFDLAQRGLLEIREEPGSWGTKNHVLVRTDQSVPLEPFEQGLLEALFKPGERRVNMSEVGARLGAKSKLFDEPLEQELIRRGWLDPERKQKRGKLMGIALFALILLMGLLIAALLLAPGWSVSIELAVVFGIFFGIGVGLFLLAIALLIYVGSYSVLTPAGEEQAARWRGFGEYLKQVSKGREPAIRPDYFERYLAYASMFGLGAAWAKYFDKLGGVPLPVWFHAQAGSHANFATMVAVMSASDSSGAGGGGGAGGAGASGGGASGAG
ncbi:MAG TPA: DUF2207 domain-containing protein [Anaerolineales bacterium]|nr:DUF2207 domain-containing protein [Anaerolineales bacterium]